MNKLFLIIHTVLHLRPIQIRYQLLYRLRRMWREVTGFNYTPSIEKQGQTITLEAWIKKPNSFHDEKFTFLNLTKKYETGSINWNETEHGKLWAYNLNYMDYLLQSEMDNEKALQLINNYIENFSKNRTGIEPYTIALRGINWIKYFSQFSQQTISHSSSLYAQYKILIDNLEYHLLANHLLEDGFSLLFAAFYFNDESFYEKSIKIINQELKEQILKDGAHFELSPMYHQIILDRLLDCINLLKNNHLFPDQLNILSLLKEKASAMIRWLNAITFSNGEIPLLNDAAPDIAPSTHELLEYAERLGLKVTDNHSLKESGYRRVNGTNYECILDIGHIGPSYQPGHAHADTLNFVLNVNNNPFIVDIGISTYNTGFNRLKERGTSSHNTVTVENLNSSEVWSAFRVAKRANVSIIKDTEKNVIAEHNGYSKLKTIHRREWQFIDDEIEITDNLSGNFINGVAHLWLSPDVEPLRKENRIETKTAIIFFENSTSIHLQTQKIPSGYNSYLNTNKIEIFFTTYLKTKITILNNENFILNR